MGTFLLAISLDVYKRQRGNSSVKSGPKGSLMMGESLEAVASIDVYKRQGMERVEYPLVSVRRFLPVVPCTRPVSVP